MNVTAANLVQLTNATGKPYKKNNTALADTTWEREPLSDDLRKIMDMFNEIEKKDKEDDEKKKLNQPIDEFMEELRVHQEKMNAESGSPEVNDKSDEADGLKWQDNAEYRKVEGRNYLKSLKKYITDKYDIEV